MKPTQILFYTTAVISFSLISPSLPSHAQSANPYTEAFERQQAAETAEIEALITAGFAKSEAASTNTDAADISAPSITPQVLEKLGPEFDKCLEESLRVLENFHKANSAEADLPYNEDEIKALMHDRFIQRISEKEAEYYSNLEDLASVRLDSTKNQVDKVAAAYVERATRVVHATKALPRVGSLGLTGKEQRSAINRILNTAFTTSLSRSLGQNIGNADFDAASREATFFSVNSRIAGF